MNKGMHEFHQKLAAISSIIFQQTLMTRFKLKFYLFFYFRLPAPMDCPEAIHQLMLDCWQKERAHRPTFSSIVKTLDKLICCPETLKKIANSPVHNPFAANVPDYSAFVSVEQWLASIKMSRYADNFRANGYDSMEAHVAKMSLQQLVDIGVTLVGHQKKIMGSIHAMRAQLSVNMSEGFLV